MNLKKNPTEAELKILVAACDDDSGPHILWVDLQGEVHLEQFDRGRHDDFRMLRLGTYAKGTGYVGRDAAEDAGHIREMFKELTWRWKEGDDERN